MDYHDDNGNTACFRDDLPLSFINEILPNNKKRSEQNLRLAILHEPSARPVKYLITRLYSPALTHNGHGLNNQHKFGISK
jgi:hypothetical protein